MSKKNKKIIEKAFDLFNASDYDGLVELESETSNIKALETITTLRKAASHNEEFEADIL